MFLHFFSVLSTSACTFESYGLSSYRGLRFHIQPAQQLHIVAWNKLDDACLDSTLGRAKQEVEPMGLLHAIISQVEGLVKDIRPGSNPSSPVRASQTVRMCLAR